MDKLMIVVLGAAGLVLSAILSGFTLSVLWEWFFVTAFDAPSLGIAQAIGISSVVTYITHQSIKQNEEQSLEEAIIKQTARSLTTLLFGFIVFQFI